MRAPALWVWEEEDDHYRGSVLMSSVPVTDVRAVLCKPNIGRELRRWAQVRADAYRVTAHRYRAFVDDPDRGFDVSVSQGRAQVVGEPDISVPLKDDGTCGTRVFYGDARAALYVRTPAREALRGVGVAMAEEADLRAEEIVFEAERAARRADTFHFIGWELRAGDREVFLRRKSFIVSPQEYTTGVHKTKWVPVDRWGSPEVPGMSDYEAIHFPEGIH